VKNRIKVLRAENDWSQARLAEVLGVSRQTINAIETCKYDASLPLAFDIARVFAKRIDEIFFPEPVVAKPAPDAVPSQELDISLI
jgi:putative transcriptional regulator